MKARWDQTTAASTVDLTLFIPNKLLMNATVAEDLSKDEIEHIKAEIGRLGEEFDRSMARMDEQQREIDRLSTFTRARLDEMINFAKKNFPSAKYFL